MRTRSIVSVIVFVLGVVSWSGCGERSDEETNAPTEVAVQVGKVVRATLRARVDAYGTVEAEPAGGGKPAGAARLSAPAAGIVMAVPAQEGQHVDAGTVIVELDDRMAVAQLHWAEQQMARQEKLQRAGGTSDKAVQEIAQQLATARAQLALVHLASPIGGMVARIRVQPGQTVDANTVVADVVDPRRLVATVDVPAAEATVVRRGQRVEIFTTLSGNRPVVGTVAFTSPQLDVKTDTVLVRVSLPADADVRPGEFVHVRIVTEERTDRLAVPREAVYTAHDGRTTLSLVDGGVARQTAVKAGLRDGDLVEVQGDGVTEGATVVTVGSYALPAETKVRIVVQ